MYKEFKENYIKKHNKESFVNYMNKILLNSFLKKESVDLYQKEFLKENNINIKELFLYLKSLNKNILNYKSEIYKYNWRAIFLKTLSLENRNSNLKKYKNLTLKRNLFNIDKNYNIEIIKNVFIIDVINKFIARQEFTFNN